MAITHAKVSPKTDVADTDLVRPSDWNAAHVGTLDHAALSAVSADQHHARSHAHDGADGSGTVAGANLTGTPGGELGGTWSAPTVDPLHGGSTHAAAQAAAQATAAAALAAHAAAGDPHAGYATDADLAAHTGDTSDAHDASAVSSVPAGGLAASNVQAALNELDSEKVPTTRTLTAGAGLAGGGTLAANRTFDVNVDGSTLEISADALRVKDGGITTAKLAFNPATQAELDAHTASAVMDGDTAGGDLSGAYPNPSVVNDSHAHGSGTAPGTAHPSLATHDALGLATDAELAAHTGDVVDAHDASAISFTPAGTIAATNVQAAIEEVAAEAGTGSALAVADGVTTVDPASTLTFPQGAVSDGGGGTAVVDVVHVEDGPPGVTAGFATGTVWIDLDDRRLWVNYGDETTPDWRREVPGLGEVLVQGNIASGLGIVDPGVIAGHTNIAATGAQIEVVPGDDDGATHGRIAIFTGGNDGAAGNVLIQTDVVSPIAGIRTALWGSVIAALIAGGGQAAFVDPVDATPEAIALSLIAAGIMAAS